MQSTAFPVRIVTLYEKKRKFQNEEESGPRKFISSGIAFSSFEHTF